MFFFLLRDFMIKSFHDEDEKERNLDTLNASRLSVSE